MEFGQMRIHVSMRPSLPNTIFHFPKKSVNSHFSSSLSRSLTLRTLLKNLLNPNQWKILHASKTNNNHHSKLLELRVSISTQLSLSFHQLIPHNQVLILNLITCMHLVLIHNKDSWDMKWWVFTREWNRSKVGWSYETRNGSNTYT
jgi:hypothetical protein